jgi:hypothetical protein
MYNITQFLLMNSSGSGTVSADEWMHFIIQRYSRATLDSVLTATETPRPFSLPDYMANIKKVGRLVVAKAERPRSPARRLPLSKPSTRGSRPTTTCIGRPGSAAKATGTPAFTR